MEWLLSEEHKLLKKMVSEFNARYVKPIASETDEKEEFPLNTVEKMKEVGLLGIPFTKTYGGAGGDYVGYALSVMELSKVCATTGVIVSAHTSLCAGPINEFGTEAQKSRYLTALASGDKLGAFALTEPSAGTDAASQKTTAVYKDKSYILNGSKIFITNAGYADVYIVIAMTDPSLKTRGMTAFIVEKDTPGFTVGKKEKKMGIRGSSTCELIFDNVVLTEDAVLGSVNQGFKLALSTLDSGRIGIAAQACGIAEGALNETLIYLKERKQFGQSLNKFQTVQFKLASMKTRLEAAKLLTMQAAVLKDQKKPFSMEAAMAKLEAAQCAMAVTTDCVQLFGGYGYTREYPVERMMRDAKITEIYEGTNEAQQMVISAHMLRGV